MQSRLKRHILTKHKEESQVAPILKMNSKEQDRQIMLFRRNAIKKKNLELIKTGKTEFIRERKAAENDTESPIMCTGCNGFFARKYKARHQVVCLSAGSNLVIPMINIANSSHYDNFSDEFKDLLNTLLLDDVGNYVKSDEIILMFGMRSFNSLKRKKDKVVEARKSVRSRMRLTARLYLRFRAIYNEQSEIVLNDSMNNAADMYRREAIAILGQTVNEISEQKVDQEVQSASISNQKSGLKISVLNLLKLTANFLMGHFLVKCMDDREQQVVQFLKVLKSYENDYFGDAYSNSLQYRRNVNLRKPLNLPKNDDVNLLITECKNIMENIDVFEHPSKSFCIVRSATATFLTIFCARRGGEPVWLQLYQWKEAVTGEWIDKDDLPNDFQLDSMLITYQTGKGADHLVPLIFPPETIKAMKFLIDKSVRKEAGVNEKNVYVFGSTKNSTSHVIGWHCIDEILKRISIQGAVNATKNRHRVSSLLAKLELSEFEKKMIYQHFGHSQNINENVYQAPAGAIQLQTTGKRLLAINSTGAAAATSSKTDFQGMVKVILKREK